MAPIAYDCLPQNNMDCYYNRFWLRLERDSGTEPPVNNFTTVQDRIDAEMYEYVMDLSSQMNKPIINKMVDLRQSYFDRTDKAPIISQLITIINRVSNIQELALVLKVLINARITTIITISVAPNFCEPDVYALCLGDMILTVESKQVYEDDDTEAITAFAVLLGQLHHFASTAWGYTGSDASTYATNVLTFEMLFAKASLSMEEINDPQTTHNVLSVQQFLEIFDKNQFWATVLSDLPASPIILFENPRLLAFLQDYLTTINSERLTMFKDYLVHCICREYGLYTSIAEAFQPIMPFTLDPKRLFINLFYEKFGFALQDRFDRLHLNPEKVIQVKTMFEQLQHYCLHTFQHMDLFDTITLPEAMLKISTLQLTIGSQAFNIDLDTMPALGPNFYDNIIRIDAFYFKAITKMIGQPTNRSYLSVDNDLFSFAVNAYYDSASNSIYVPTAILDDTFFNLEADPIDNFGGLGVVLGHEMTHCFDNIGAQFDHKGHLRNWWSPLDYHKFGQTIASIYNHYANLKVDGLRINPELSLSESIADIGGIKLALRTYLANYEPDPSSSVPENSVSSVLRSQSSLISPGPSSFVPENSVSSVLRSQSSLISPDPSSFVPENSVSSVLRSQSSLISPGLDLDHLSIAEKSYLQRFFQKWVQTLRSYTSIGITHYEIENDVHPPSIIRVNAPFAHVNEYYQIYDVQPGQRNYLPPDKRTKLLDITKD